MSLRSTTAEERIDRPLVLLVLFRLRRPVEDLRVLERELELGRALLPGLAKMGR